MLLYFKKFAKCSGIKTVYCDSLSRKNDLNCMLKLSSKSRQTGSCKNAYDLLRLHVVFRVLRLRRFDNLLSHASLGHILGKGGFV